MAGVNLWAVLAAALSSFVLGGLWYGPLFGKRWLRESGRDAAQAGSGHPVQVFGGALVFSLLAAFVFAVFLGPAPQLDNAVMVGLVAGFCWVASSFGINYLFARRSALLWMIDGGYHTVQFGLFGLILGLWH